MKTTMQKYEIINLKLRGWSNSKIRNTFGISRDTIRKYWNEYETNLSSLLEKDSNVDTTEVIEKLVSKPTYNVSNRKPRKYNEEIDKLLEKILKDEEEKNKKLGTHHKQALTQSQIYKLIKDAGYDIGKTTIQIKINEKKNKYKEAYIKQSYPYGQRFEYDFGEVKLMIGGKFTKGFMAVMTSPASGFRWAYLYHNSKMDVFLDSQTRFFEMVKGCYEEGVYDNMRNVVTKFIGRNEKQLNEELIKFATYYGFKINICNCFSGNEKGTVESAVKWIRNKVFAVKYEFDSFEMAETYLEEELKKINKDSTIDEEMKHLTPYRPKYEIANISVNNVDKYSFVRIDNNFYSVPEQLIDKNVVIKTYPNVIKIFYNGENVATHQRFAGKNKTCVDIKHYLRTFMMKPGALRNSEALNSVPRLKDIFDTYYKDNPKSFISILNDNKHLSLEQIIEILQKGNNPKFDQESHIEEEVRKQLESINQLFIGGNDKYVNVG